MNKKLTAIGIAAALALPTAAAWAASVEVYGQARVALDYQGNNASAPNPNPNNISVKKDALGFSDYASRLGFKGDEDLGSGLTALWQLEEGVSFDTNNAIAARSSYVGLGGVFGTMIVGKLETPYKTSTDNFDPFQDTAADANGILGNVGATGLVDASQDESNATYDLWTNNTIAYITPNLSGFQAKLAYVMPSVLSGNDGLPATAGNANPTSVEQKQDAYNAGLSYDMGPWLLIANYISLNNVVPVGNSHKNLAAWKVGGAYTIRDVTTVALVFENADAGIDSRGSVKSRNAYYLSAKHRIGDTTLKLAYGGAEKMDGATQDNGAYQISVGASQGLSKYTEVYVLYSQLHNNSAGTYSMAYGPLNAAAGKDEDVFSIGINHMFSSK